MNNYFSILDLTLPDLIQYLCYRIHKNIRRLFLTFRNDPKFSDRYQIYSEKQSDQGLHCLPFRLHRWTYYTIVEPRSSNFRVITIIFWGVRIFRKFTMLSIRLFLDNFNVK